MALDPDRIRATLDELIHPDARGRLLARGTARGMVWRGGELPKEAHKFPPELTPDLLDFGYGVLALALELRDENRKRSPESRYQTTEYFRVASEALESAARHGSADDLTRGRHLVVCAAALHLAGFAARAYSVLSRAMLDVNLSSAERALGFLIRRELAPLREHIITWLADPKHSDDAVALRLADEEDEFDSDDAIAVAVMAAFHRNLGRADTALMYGDFELMRAAERGFDELVEACVEARNVSLWWVTTLTAHLWNDLWDATLHQLLPLKPTGDATNWPLKRSEFIAQMAVRSPPQLDLWPSQLEAARRAIDPTDPLVIALPTSAGKTRIAELCILRALADSKRCVYVTPLRALSAQVERVLARTFVPLGASVSSLYGSAGTTTIDANTLGKADVVVATPEKLDFAIRQDPDVLTDVGLIVFDEGHMIGLGSREIRYEVLIQRLLRRTDAKERRIVCLSAMFNALDPNFQDFGEWLRADAPGSPVNANWRPTRRRTAILDWAWSSNSGRLEFIGDEEAYVPHFVRGQAAIKPKRKPFPGDDRELCIAAADKFIEEGHTVLIYAPQRSLIEPMAEDFEDLAKRGYLKWVKAPAESELKVPLALGREWLGEDHPAVLALKVGVGTHHAGLPRPFQLAVERLLDARKLKVVVASPTLAQGVDLACSVLIFRTLDRFDAKSGGQAPISPAEFANVLGRAGRAFVDVEGIAVLPNFKGGSTRRNRTKTFHELLSGVEGQLLASGLVQLVSQLIAWLSQLLDVPHDKFADFVLNQHDLWDDAALTEEGETDEDDEAVRTLPDFLADLDVALFTLIDPLDAPIEKAAGLLDEILKGSLWERTLKRPEYPPEAAEVLRSRAQWLWRKTTPAQRTACYRSGLGSKPGIFLYQRLDTFVGQLADWHAAIQAGKAEDAAKAAIAFAAALFEEPFFSVKTLPEKWEELLAGWIAGTAFADLLSGRKPRDRQRAQAFIQDGVIYKMVWAAEAVRVQAISAQHPRAEELGDGPALALTHGTPSIPAALVCQSGYASRTGAVHATRKLDAAFVNLDGLEVWRATHAVDLARPEFWGTEDQHTLWRNQGGHTLGSEPPRRWIHGAAVATPHWTAAPPLPGTRVRILPATGGIARLCADDLAPLGKLALAFDISTGWAKARVEANGTIAITYFGPNQPRGTHGK